MTRMILALLLCSSTVLMAQSDDSNPYAWGPGEVGTCVSEEDFPPTPALKVPFTPYFMVGNSLYRRDRWNSCHEKVADFGFRVEGVDVQSYYQNSTVILWCEDGARRYDLETGAITPYVSSGFLSSFLAHPIVSGTAEAGSRGCFGGDLASAELEPVADTTPEPSLLYEQRPVDRAGSQRLGINSPELMRVLRRLNQTPDYLPSIDDFRFDEEDFSDFTQIVDEACHRRTEYLKEYGDVDLPVVPFSPTCENRDIYLSILSRPDDITPHVVRSALSEYDASKSITVWYLASVRLVNEAGDTLAFTTAHQGGTQPYHLPWTVTYRETEFITWDVELARLLLSMVPEDEIERERREAGAADLPSANQNAQALRVIAGYLTMLEGD